MKRWFTNLLLVLISLFSFNIPATSAEGSLNNSAESVSPTASKQTLLEKARKLREDQQELFGKAKGVLVSTIMRDSQGEKVGLQSGDILLAYDNVPLESAKHLIKLTNNKPENSSVELAYLRNTSQQTVSILGGKIGVRIHSLVLSQSELLTTKMQRMVDKGITDYKKGDYHLAKESFSAGLILAESSNNQAWQASFLSNLGLIFLSLNDYPQALDYYQQYLVIVKELGILADEAECLNNLGTVSNRLGNYPQALEYHQQSLAIQRELGNRMGIAISLNNLGVVYERLEEYQHALDYYQKSLAIKQELGDREQVARSFYNLGNVSKSLNQYPQALEYYQQSLALFRELDNQDGVEKNLSSLSNLSESLNKLGLDSKRLGKYLQALDYFQQALVIQRELGDRAGVAASLNILGIVSFNLSQYSQALDYHKQSLELKRELGDRAGEADNLNNMGNVSLRLSQYPQALKYHQQSLALQREFGDRTGVAASLNNLGVVSFRLSQYSQALDYHKQSLELKRELGDRAGEADNLNNMGNVSLRLSQYPQALKYYQKSLALQREIGNRLGEVASLTNLGSVSLSLSQYLQAREYYQQSLALSRELGNRAGEVKNLTGLGLVHENLSQYPQAQEVYQQSLTLKRKLGDRAGEATSLNNLGSVSSHLGQYPQARDYFQQSLTLQRELGGRIGEALSLNNLGQVSYRLSQYPQALEYFQQALVIDQELGNRAGEADNLNNMGLVYQDLSQYPQAQEVYQQSLALQQKLGNRKGEAVSLNNLGGVSHRLSQYPQALEYFQQSLVIKRGLGDRAGEARSLGNLGIVYSSLRQYTQALEYSQRSLTLQRELGNRAGELISLSNLGLIYRNLSNYSQALDHYQQALAIASQVGAPAPDTLWRAWTGLANTYLKLDQNNPAILAGKQAVNVLQSIRTNNIDLEKGQQKSFLEGKKFVYRNLADTLIEQGRLPEAEQVMAMLKEEEYFDFIQRDGEEDGRSTKASFTGTEQSVVIKLEKFNTQLLALGKKHEALVNLSKADQNARTQLTAVEADLDESQAGYIALLSTLKDLLKSSSEEEVLAANLGRMESQQKLLTEINAVIITTVVTKDKLHLLLTTPKEQLARQSPIGEKALNKLIERFRNALKHPGSDPLRLAQELYKHLVKPLEKDLKQTGAATLMWSLDGSLRYLPLSVLHDGEHYLIERYALSLYTAAAHNNLSENNIDVWRVAGLGVSLEHPGFIALPAVPQELESIVRRDKDDKDGVIPGEIYLDQAFNRESFKVTLRDKYPVLHIASHFKLQPSDSSASKLLLGDGDTLSLDEFRRKAAFKLHGVDLLTLSACDTAMGGNGEGGEVESFAVMAQLRGAKGVLASLWKVQDESTGLLMQQFYQLRSENTQLSKAEALRQAQLTLLHGETGLKANYSHPYFWAPFVMMGNWL